MGRSQRAKGIRGELEARAILRQLTGVEWERSARQAGLRGGEGCPDLIPTSGCHRLHPEVKVGAAPPVIPALHQAERDCTPGSVPVVLARRDRDGWVLAVRAEQLWELVEALGGRRPARGTHQEVSDDRE